MVEHATAGLVVGVVGISMPLYAVRELMFPLWCYLLPDGEASDQLGLWAVTDWVGACSMAVVFGLGWIAAILGLTPVLARLQAAPERRLRQHAPDADLSLRVTQLTATRAAALDANATELRRIERALHDGTQNRLVAVTVLGGRGPPGRGPRRRSPSCARSPAAFCRRC